MYRTARDSANIIFALSTLKHRGFIFLLLALLRVAMFYEVDEVVFSSSGASSSAAAHSSSVGSSSAFVGIVEVAEVVEADQRAEGAPLAESSTAPLAESKSTWAP